MTTSKPIIFDGVVPATLSPDTASAGVGIVAISDPTVLTGSGIITTGSTSASTGTVSASTGTVSASTGTVSASTGTASTGSIDDPITASTSTGTVSTGTTGDSSTGGGENKKNYTTYIIIALAVALTASISYMIYKSVKK